jgi:hypothetical protein
MLWTLHLNLNGFHAESKWMRIMWEATVDRCPKRLYER